MLSEANMNLSIGYDIASIVLGLIAMALPALFFALRKGETAKMVLVSLGACGLSLVLQFLHIRLLAEAGDFSSIQDTIGPLSCIAALLASMTVILNILAVWRGKKVR